MTTITKERLIKIQLWRETYGPGSNVVLPAEEAEELARIALASIEAEAVGEVSEQRDGLVMDGTIDLGGASTHRIIKGASKMKRLPLGTKFYTAPPAPANSEPVAWLWSHRKHQSEVTLVRPEDDERAEGAHWSGWSCQALYAAPPETVSVPDVHHSIIAEQLAHVLSNMDATDHQRAVISCAVDRLNKVSQLLQFSPSALLVPEMLDYQGAKELYNYLMTEEETNATVNGCNACRAAMLQGTINHTEDKLAMVDHSGDSNNMVEPVTTTYKYPDDFICMLTGRAKYLREKGEIKSPELLERAAAALQEEIVNTPPIPNGWKLVPIDPTKDMLRAGQSVVGFWLNTVHCYSKMLAAAPAAPQQEVK